MLDTKLHKVYVNEGVKWDLCERLVKQCVWLKEIKRKLRVGMLRTQVGAATYHAKGKINSLNPHKFAHSYAAENQNKYYFDIGDRHRVRRFANMLHLRRITPGTGMHLESHLFYPYSEAEKLAIRKEVGIKDSILQEDIDAILDWFYKEPHLADSVIDRDYVEKMLVATRCSREKCKRKIDHFYRYRFYAPELIQTRVQQLSNPDYDPWSFYRQAAIPKLFNGKRISVFKVTDPNPSSFQCEVPLRNTIMLGDLRMKYDYMLGDIWVMDLLNATIGHVLRVNPTLMQKFTHILQDGIGIKLYEVHIINASSFSQHFVNLFKPFVKPKIMGRIRFHNSFEELQEFIPKQYLPKDFGGDQPSLDEFKEMYRAEIQKPQTKDYLIKCCQQVSNEQKRNGGKYNEDYLKGSFKKLDID